jgi:hypothetical protein
MIVKRNGGERGEQTAPAPVILRRARPTGSAVHRNTNLDVNVSVFEITGLVVVGVGFLGLIAYVARHARQWDDD